MGTPAAVSVDNNLATSEASVGSGTTAIELSGRVDDDLCALEHVLRDHLLDDLLGESLLDDLVGDLGVVLSRDKNVVHSERHHLAIVVAVLNDDLGLAVWAQPGDGAILSLNGHLLTELVSKVVRVGVEDFGVPLVSGISKHKALVTSTSVLFGLSTSVNGGCDVSILRLDVGDDLAVGAVKTDSLRGVANLAADLASDLFEVDRISTACLSKKHNLKREIRLEFYFMMLTMPVLVAVSMAHLALGLSLRQASRQPSEI